MNEFQKVVKYIALALALLLVVGIIAGIVSGIAAIAALFDDTPDSEILGEMTTHAVSQDITALEIDVGATELIIEQGDTLSIETNHQKLRVTERRGSLVIEETVRINHYPTGLKLILTVPADHVFDTVEIDAGAGRLTVESLTADNIDLDLGAGEVDIHHITARSSADIDGGAGKMSVDSGVLNDLDLDMGVGELKLDCMLTGHCDLDLGVGGTRLTLPGTADDYKIRVSKGLGGVTLDGKSVPGGTYGNGSDYIDISGGVGGIDINFIEE